MAKILLVEDDNNLREIYEARLQAEGYTIISARDGEEALVFAKSENPDLVISDVMMPKISGFEMLDILRNTEGLKHVKVIMLTALGQSEDQQRASRLGADHYLVKSQVTLEDIVKVAHELLDDTPLPEPTPTPVPEPVVAAPVVPEPVAPVVPEPVVEPVAPAPVPTPEPFVAAPPIISPVESAPPVSDPLLSVAALFSSATNTPVEPEQHEAVVAEQEQSAEIPVVTAPPEYPEENKEVAADEKAVEEVGPQSTAQEEASVEAKIEDFVTGASSDPSVPAPHALAEPSAPVSGIPQAIINSEPSSPPTLAAAPASEPVLSSPTLNPAGAASIIRPTGSLTIPTPEDTASEVASGTPHVVNNNAINHRKVITPDAGAPKQDLGALLAKEAASYDASPATAPSVASTPAPATPPQTPPPLPGADTQADSSAPTTPPPLDPNSIAL